MTRVCVYAAAISLLLPGLALAQSNPERGHENGGHAPAHGQPGSMHAQGHPQGMQQMQQMQHGHQGMQPTQRRHQGMQQERRRSYPVTMQPLPPRGNQFWHRGRYHGRVHAPAYVYSHGWHYRRWIIGERMPPYFFAPAYFYAGWAVLGLQAPVPGYAWVRFGPDLVLVNLTTGEIEDVIYGVFY